MLHSKYLIKNKLYTQMKRIGLMILFSALLLPLAFGQVTREKPEWAIKPVHVDGETSYIITIKAFGYGEDDVRSQANKQIEQERKRNLGIRDNGADESSGNSFTYAHRILDEWWEADGPFAYGYFLVQMCKENKCEEWEHVEVDATKYPFSARCFVPGMAQIYKGSKVKGGLIIGGEALGVAGIVTCFSMKATNEKWFEESFSVKDKQYYADRADMWQNIGWGCVAFTAALYIYNIIDGAVAPGQKHIQLGKKSYNYAIAPVVSTRGDLGLAMRLNF
jgi:hypothetical protein